MTPNIIVLAALVALLAGCGEKQPPADVPEPKLEGDTIIYPGKGNDLSVLVSAPAVARTARAIRLNGRIAWNEDETVRVYTPFAGRVQKISVQQGDMVKKGQALAILASPEFGQAQSDASRAESDFALATKNLERVRELVQNGVAPGKDLQTAEADFARTQAEAARARERLKLYGSQATTVDQTYVLSSPIAGTVVERNINPGQELRPDQMVANAPALFVISDPGTLWVWLDASEKDLRDIKPNKNISIRSPAYPNAIFDAVIFSVSDSLDPSTRTIKVRASLENNDRRLKAEMFVTAEIDRESRPVLQVPAKAVFFQGGKRYVFTEDRERYYTRREVLVGDTDEGLITILSGLEEGQRVVTEGSLMLQQVLKPRRVVK